MLRPTSQQQVFFKSNENHWSEIERNKEIHFFQKKFLSHLNGYIKPDKNCFLNVINELKCLSKEIVFFDDTLVNINKAKELGFHAIHVNGINDVLQKINYLKKENIL